MKKTILNPLITLLLLLLPVLFTWLVLHVDVQSVGPQGTEVGFATLNLRFSEWTGASPFWHYLTGWLGMGALLLTLTSFGLLGGSQWIRRKHLLRVDRDILFLGIFCLLVAGVYAFFEYNVINYRPVLLNGVLEASYPSSHVLLVVCILGMAIPQLSRRIHRKNTRHLLTGLILVIIGITIVGRILSGVHWFTDIIAALLMAAALIRLYARVLNILH